MDELAEDLDVRLSALWRTLGRRGKREMSRTAASVLATLRDTGPRRITELAEAEASRSRRSRRWSGASSATGSCGARRTLTTRAPCASI